MIETIKEFFKKPEGMVTAAVAGIILACVIVYVIISGDEEEEAEYSVNISEEIEEQPSEEEPSSEGDDQVAEEGEEVPSSGQSSLSPEEVSSIEGTVEDLLMTTGNFGVDREGFSGQLTDEEVVADGIFESRAETYAQVEDRISSSSDYSFSEERIANWDEDAFAGFSVSEVSIDDILGPVVRNDSGSNVRSVEVDVNWSGQEFYYEVTSTDTSWDGSYHILERDYEESDAVIGLIEEDGQWKLNTISGVNNIHATALWSSPSPERSPFADQLQNVGTTSATIDPLDESTLDPMPDPTPSPNELDEKIESDIDRGFRDRMYSPPRETGNN